MGGNSCKSKSSTTPSLSSFPYAISSYECVQSLLAAEDPPLVSSSTVTKSVRGHNGSGSDIRISKRKWLLPFVRGSPVIHSMDREAQQSGAPPPPSPRLFLERVVLYSQSPKGGSENVTYLRHATSLWKRIPFLVSVDLQACKLSAALLSSLAAVHGKQLKKLYLLHRPGGCIVKQDMLNPFTCLEELDIAGCQWIDSLDFCAATLRVLYANSTHLRDHSFQNAVHLEVLHVCDAPYFFSVAPFAATLRELDCSGQYCGVNNAGLRDATSIQRFNCTANAHITTIAPFAASLRYLRAAYGCPFSPVNNGLSQATNIIQLDIQNNDTITSLAPFAHSLRELTACSDSGITDQELSVARHLVKLDVWGNNRITSVAPCAATLRTLKAGFGSAITDEGLCTATKIVELDVHGNAAVTTVQPFAVSLLVLVASDANCGISDEGLWLARSLFKLRVDNNIKVTKIEPFAHSLRILYANHSPSAY